ncbi:MAG: N-acetylmuramoyl-L-alanine amidase [Acidobacteria bacterium]|nr:N-acetylmuramoyl-L-alanine amidase [Acidobacteriota bacterium]
MMGDRRGERNFAAVCCTLAAMLVLSLCPAAAAWERDKAERAWREATELRERIAPDAPRSEYARCAEGFRRVYLYDPHYVHAPEALYAEGLLRQWMGEKFDAPKELLTAAARFEFLARDYPAHRDARDARRRAAAIRSGREPGRASEPSPAAAAPAPEIAAAEDPSPEEGGGPRGAVVHSIRVFSLGDVTRVTIDLDRKTGYSRARLRNPERVYFDLAGADLAEGLADRPIPVGTGHVERIRAGRHSPGAVRVVLDLTSPLEYTVREMGDPFRIEIDLRPPGAATRSAEALTPAPPPQAPPPQAAAASLTPPPARPAEERTAPAESAAPTAAPRTSRGDRTLTRMLGLKIGRIVLDPGHGGHDLGTVGPNGLREKDLTLAIARELKAMLEDELGAHVFLTRDTDVYVSLEERTALANHYRADLFLSIHANSSRHRSTSGVETYYLDFAKNDAEREIAARENASGMLAVSELEDLVKQIAQAEKSAESRELASIMQKRLYTGARRLLPSTKDRGVRRAPFIVLIGARMPSILAEVAFISNPKDEGVLGAADGRKAMARALYDGIVGYMQTLGGDLVQNRKDGE